MIRKLLEATLTITPNLKIWASSSEMQVPKINQTIKQKPLIVNMKEYISFSEAYIKDIMNAG